MTPFLPWTVLNVSMLDRLPDLPAGAGSGGIFVVFWCGPIALGQLLIPAAMLPVSSAQLTSGAASIVAPAVGRLLLGTGFEPGLPVPPRRQFRHAPPDLARLLAIDRPLASVSRAAGHETPRSAHRSVSLVICTRNRPQALHQCLSAVDRLDPAPDETIVVDNDPSSGATPPVTEQFPGIRYVAQPRPGLSAARNAGLRECRCAIVAFTDDDVLVHAGWLGAIQAAFDEGTVMAVTGLVLPAQLDTAAQFIFQNDAADSGWGYRAVDFDGSFFATMKGLGVPVWRLGAGANMAFRREAFDAVGVFDERLGAGASGCSEDSEMWYRLLAEGYRCRYTPLAVVFHSHRQEWDGLSRQMFSYMRGHIAALFFQFQRYGHWGNLYRASIALPWYLARVTVRSALRRAGTLVYRSRPAVVSSPLAAQLSGLLAGYVYALRHYHTVPGSSGPVARPCLQHARFNGPAPGCSPDAEP